MKIFKHKIIIEIILSIIIIFMYMYEINNRNFLCFSNGACVTTWEDRGLIIIPYKYYGLLKPEKYVLSMDSGAGGYGASIYLSKNPQYKFIVNAYRMRNFSANEIMTIMIENNIEEYNHQHLENNAIQNESYNIDIGTDFVGGGTIIDKWKDGKKETIVEAYRIFQNGYIPFLIIIFIIFFIRWIYIKPVINNKSLKEKIKTILLFIIGSFFESIVVILINILLVISIIALIMLIFNR